MLKKILKLIKEEFIKEHKTIFIMVVLYIILMYPLNYYIIVGGGTSDISSRIKVDNKYESKGSFNISYVTELEGNILTYGLSYIIPKWERESVDDYKYSKKENVKDIEFRSKLDLLKSNGNATYWAYKLANKEVKIESNRLYIIITFDGYDTPLKVGDEILSVDGNYYETISELREYIQKKKENDEVTMRIKRKNKEQEIKIKIYKYEDKLILGVALECVKEYNTNPEIKIKFKRSESGPSGGLITTLEAYNQLTKKDLTKGKKITGTGTIEEDGSIGQIGGVEYKLLGAAHDKSDIFIVPDGQNYKDALKYKKKKNLKIKIIKVKTIEDAINKLEKLK